MSYLVLARKYRPQGFDDLVGQEHVTRTLANAIAQDRVAHAFLFTGVRGVGKTTSARILAKCLNCLGSDGKATGPTATPCQTCAACTEIAAGADMDVQEIDGASYTGVDDVRKLQQTLAFRPARDRFKIYIVDEVHMLSNAAWNAFLKTLEEPPPHVTFIFATTEVHKVPVTILSRCQRYDFKLVPAKTIGARLREVLAQEKLSADDAAISVLAREAAGSMRDAMSLLDQVIAYGGETITAEDVARVLGVADRVVLHQLTGALLDGEAANALSVLDAMARQGFDLVHLCRDLLAHMRDVVVAKVCTPEQARELLDVADEEVADLLAMAERHGLDDLTRVYQGLSRGFDEIVRSGQVRAALEMTLVRLAQRPALLPLDELLARLGDLEKRLATGAPPPARGGGSASSGGGGRGVTRETATRPSAKASASAAPVAHGEPLATSSGADRPTAGALGDLAPRGAAPAPPASSARPVSSTAPEPQTNGALALDVTPAPSPSAGDAGEGDAITLFRALLERVRAVRPDVASALELAAPLSVTRERIVLGFQPETFEDFRAEDTAARDVLAEQARAMFGAPASVDFEVSARGSKVASVAYLDAVKKKQLEADARAAVERHELVRAAIALFDAELKEIKLPVQED